MGALNRPGRLRVIGIVAAAVLAVAVVATAAYAKDIFNTGTYGGTVTPQESGASPFPMRLTVKVKVKKKKKTKTISNLQIGPIPMVCSVNPGDVAENVTLAELSGFPAIKSTGFFETSFIYSGGRWKILPNGQQQTADPEVDLRLVQDGGKDPEFVSNGGSMPGMTITLKADVTGTSATMDPAGASTCDVENSYPTLTLQR